MSLALTLGYRAASNLSPKAEEPFCNLALESRNAWGHFENPSDPALPMVSENAGQDTASWSVSFRWVVLCCPCTPGQAG